MHKIWQSGCPQLRHAWHIKVLMVLAMVLCTAVVNAAVTVQGMRVSSFASNTRLVFDCDQSPEYHVLSLYQPTRLVVDFPKGRWRGALPVLSSKDQQIKAIRVTCGEDARTPKVCAVKAGKAPQHVRVVLDLKQPVATDVFVLPPVSKPRYRLVVDLIGKGRKQPGGVKAQKPLKKVNVAALAPTLSVPTLVHQLSDQSRPVVVVIDPGHGGKDPGATGLWGTHEKDVALRIAKALQRELNVRPGFKAYLTRDRDVFVPLRQRLEKARHYHADMFVSIHADAFRKRSAAGASVYALSAHGATSEAARWLAASENSVALMGGVSLDDKGNVLRGVLLDLSQTATTTASVNVGRQLLKQLRTVTRLHRKKVDQAAFVVLKSPDIPSVLVETGFLSNPKEEERLRDQMHQRRFARAMAKGLEAYFSVTPPRDTYFAWRLQHQVRRYQVRSGDTLSGIANRYHCSLREVQKRNGNVTDHLRVGQTVVIPHCAG